MTHQTILEVSNPFDVYVRHKGDGMVKFIILGSTSCNPQYIVRLYGSGNHLVVDMTDLKEYGMPSQELDLDIPESWMPQIKGT
jgi:hypothetical protein